MLMELQRFQHLQKESGRTCYQRLVTGGNVPLVTGELGRGSLGEADIDEIGPLGAKAMLSGTNAYGYLMGSLRLPYHNIL